MSPALSPSVLLRKQWRRAPFTLSVLGVCLTIFAITAVQSGSLVDNLAGSSLASAFTLYAPFMHTPVQDLRALGALVVHNGPNHLVMNGLMMWLLGKEVERGIGPWNMAVACVACGLGSSLGVMIGDPLAPTVGLSGVIFGLVPILAAMRMGSRRDVQALAIMALVWLGYSLLGSNISLAGHLGGLLAGVVVGGAWWLAHRARRWGLAPRMWWLIVAFEVCSVWWFGQRLVW